MTTFDAIEQAYNNGYRTGKAKAEENAAKEIAKLTAELDKCEEQYNKLWEYTQEKHKQISKLTEQLQAERDALLADVKNYQGSICCYCKHIVRAKGIEPKCKVFGEFPITEDMPLCCGKWEWRGISLAEKTSDKQEEK